MRVLVCGSRNWHDRREIYATLDRLAKDWGPDVVVIEGDAKGVDRMAGYWARKHRFENVKFPVTDADWKAHGKGAGPKRNARMLAEGRPDLVVAFPGGSGTRNMIDQATAAGVPVIEPLWPVRAEFRDASAAAQEPS